MQHCEKCKVDLTGEYPLCPLCQGPLIGEPQPEDNIFPIIPPNHHRLWIRIMAFISIVIDAAALFINLAFPSGGWWCLFIVAGLACLWISFSLALAKRKNIPKGIIWQVFLLSVLAIGWDHFTGRHGWSVDYVVPLLCSCAILAMMMVGKIMNRRISDYLVYLMINIFFCLVPMGFLLWSKLSVLWPTLFCLAISLISLAALIIFQGANLLGEIQRRLHM